MKAILIDPTKRTVSGIEIESAAINVAIEDRQIKVLLMSSAVGLDKTLFYDGYASQKEKPGFWLKGLPQHISGRALLLGRDEDSRLVSTKLTVKDVECLVKFSL